MSSHQRHSFALGGTIMVAKQGDSKMGYGSSQQTSSERTSQMTGEDFGEESACLKKRSPRYDFEKESKLSYNQQQSFAASGLSMDAVDSHVAKDMILQPCAITAASVPLSNSDIGNRAQMRRSLMGEDNDRKPIPTCNRVRIHRSLNHAYDGEEISCDLPVAVSDKLNSFEFLKQSQPNYPVPSSTRPTNVSKNKKIALKPVASMTNNPMDSQFQSDNHTASGTRSSHNNHSLSWPAELLGGKTISREASSEYGIEPTHEHGTPHFGIDNASVHFENFSEHYWEEDDETYFTEMKSSIAGDPDVIAIGILTPSNNDLESEDLRAASELAAKDIAEKEHMMKMKRNHLVFERRVSAPASIALMKTEKKREAHHSPAHGKTLVQQSILSVAKKPPRAPLRKESSVSDEDVPPQTSAQKTKASRDKGDLNVLGQYGSTRLKSDSLISLSTSSMRVRETSNPAPSLNHTQSDCDDLHSDDEMSELQDSGRSIVTNSSGVELDEKTRENIIVRSSSFHIARRKSSLWQRNTGNPSSENLYSRSSVTLPHLREIASIHDEELVIPAVASLTDHRKTTHRPHTLKSEAKILALSSNTKSYSHYRPCDSKPNERTSSGNDNQRIITKEHLKARNEAVLLATGVHIEEEETSCDLDPEQALHPMPTADIRLGQELSEVTHDLEAQAGVPVVLPGAFAVRPAFLAGEDVTRGSATGYDSGYEEQSLDGRPDMPEIEITAGEEHADDAPSFQPVVSSDPVEAELYEIDYADALVLESENELAKQRHARHRILKVVLPLLCIFLVIGIPVAFFGTKGNERKVCDRCIPEIQGWNELGHLIMGPTDTDSIEFGFSIAMAADGNRIAVGLPGLDGGDANTVESTVGGVYIIDFNGTDWIRSAEILGMEKDAKAGSSVSISKNGKRMALGAPNSNGEGYVMIYEEQATGLWEMVGEKISPPYLSTSGSFGTSLAMSSDGTILAVGDRYSDLEEETRDVGALLMFYDDGGVWQQLGQMIYGEGENELFGWAVALSGDGLRVAASAVGTDDLKGEVQVYDFIDNFWVPAGRTLVGENDRETFGSALSISEDGAILAVGAPGYSKGGTQSGTGRVSVFTYDAREQSWRSKGSSIEGDAQFDRFGSALVLSTDGSSVAIGSPENDVYGENAGFIKVMEYDGSTWVPVGSNLGRGGSLGGLFGFSVASSSDLKRVVGGAPKLAFDGKVSKVGQVWAFEQSKREGT